MARILVGIMGDAGGHISQALAVANEMPHHEFLFIGGGRVLDLRRMGYAVEEVPVPSTYYVNNRVDVAGTVRNAVKVLFDRRRTVERIVQIAKHFDPALVLTAYEYFAPLAARKLGIPSVSIDNHHFLNKCVYQVPKGQTVGRWMYAAPLRWMFSNADYFFVSAFYKLPPIDPRETEIFPPVLRRAVLEVVPADGDHVLVYQTSPTFQRLVAALEQMPRKIIVYGLGARPSSKNMRAQTAVNDRVPERPGHMPVSDNQWRTQCHFRSPLLRQAGILISHSLCIRTIFQCLHGRITWIRKLFPCH